MIRKLSEMLDGRKWPWKWLGQVTGGWVQMTKIVREICLEMQHGSVEIHHTSGRIGGMIVTDPYNFYGVTINQIVERHVKIVLSRLLTIQKRANYYAALPVLRTQRCGLKFCMNEWQDIWDCCQGNKLHSLYPKVGTVKPEMPELAQSDCQRFSVQLRID